MKLTKSSEKALMDRHTGSGHVFISDGSGKGLKRTDIGFVKKGDVYLIWMGNREAISLTPEQVKVIGDFFIDDKRD